jgi:hypothetical protein
MDVVALYGIAAVVSTPVLAMIWLAWHLARPACVDEMWREVALWTVRATVTGDSPLSPATAVPYPGGRHARHNKV